MRALLYVFVLFSAWPYELTEVQWSNCFFSVISGMAPRGDPRQTCMIGDGEESMRALIMWHVLGPEGNNVDIFLT